jgi:hypothetical protein
LPFNLWVILEVEDEECEVTVETGCGVVAGAVGVAGAVDVAGIEVVIEAFELVFMEVGTAVVATLFEVGARFVAVNVADNRDGGVGIDDVEFVFTTEVEDAVEAVVVARGNAG